MAFLHGAASETVERSADWGVMAIPGLAPPAFRFGFRALGRWFFSWSGPFHFGLPEPKRGSGRIIDDAQPAVLSRHHDLAMDGGAETPGLFGHPADVIRHDIGDPEGF